jgi:hypothetical protein
MLHPGTILVYHWPYGAATDGDDRQGNGARLSASPALFIFEVNCITENALTGRRHGVMTYVDAVKRFVGAAERAG